MAALVPRRSLTLTMIMGSEGATGLSFFGLSFLSFFRFLSSPDEEEELEELEERLRRRSWPMIDQVMVVDELVVEEDEFRTLSICRQR